MQYTVRERTIPRHTYAEAITIADTLRIFNLKAAKQLCINAVPQDVDLTVPVLTTEKLNSVVDEMLLDTFYHDMDTFTTHPVHQ